MNAHENPPGFIVRTEAQKAAFDNGFRIERGVENGWLRYASATANGDSGGRCVRLQPVVSLDQSPRRCGRDRPYDDDRRRAWRKDPGAFEPRRIVRSHRPRLPARRQPAGRAATSLSQGVGGVCRAPPRPNAS